MLKNFLFTALLLNMIATYLSFTEMKRRSSRKPFLFMLSGLVLLILMVGLTIDLYFNSASILLHSPVLLWILFIISVVIEIFSIAQKIIPGQLLAASLLLFLVIPTIFSVGIFLLILAIIELIIAFIIFRKNRDLGMK